MKPNITAIIQSMPETDRDLKAREDWSKAQEKAQAEAPDQPKPKPPQFGEASKFTGPEPVAAKGAFTQILDGDRESILELLALVRDPADADYKDYKAAYVLHGVVLEAGKPGNDRKRKLMAEVLGSQITSKKHSVPTRNLFVRELQLLGGKEVTEKLSAILNDKDLGEFAIQALLAIDNGVAGHLRKALGNSTGKNRLAIIHALGTLRDRDSSRILRKDLTSDDADVKRTTAWALANIGDPQATREILKAADNSQGWERDQYTKYALLLAERLTTQRKSKEASEIYSHLRQTRKDSKYLQETLDRITHTSA